MIKLPSGVDIKNLIKDLRIFCWEASEILIYYSQILKDSKNNSNIVQNNNYDNPGEIMSVLTQNQIPIDKHILLFNLPEVLRAWIYQDEYF